jgi:hypothetical protein
MRKPEEIPAAIAHSVVETFGERTTVSMSRAGWKELERSIMGGVRRALYEVGALKPKRYSLETGEEEP